MKFDVLTLFPEMLTAYLQQGVLGRAVKKGLVDVNLINIRDFARGTHKTTDDRPYGGGEGMVMKPGPIYRALKSVDRVEGKSPVILLSPQESCLINRLRGKCPGGISSFLSVAVTKG